MTTIQQAIETLKENGYRLTDKREILLETIFSENRYLTAKDIQEKIQEEFPSISQDTIYRNLYTFMELNFLEQTEWEGEKWFRFRCDTDQHHHHFICTACGKTKELAMCPMTFFGDQLPGCQISSHRFEIFGMCENCHQSAS